MLFLVCSLDFILFSFARKVVKGLCVGHESIMHKDTVNESHISPRSLLFNVGVYLPQNKVQLTLHI